MSSPDLPEFLLAVACSAWPPSPSVDETIRLRAGEVRDWALFEQIVRRHRIVGLAHRGLLRSKASVPAEVVGDLARIAARDGLMAQAFEIEALSLGALFKAAGLPVVFVKGASLASMAYGAVDIRHCRDVDLLVDKDQTDRAFTLLAEAGYRPVTPLPEESVRRYWREYAKNCEFVGPSGRIIELHWRLVNNPGLLRGVDVHSASRMVRVGRGELPTLVDDLLLPYLCVHGAVHGWSRLKWLADVRAFLATREPDDVARLYATARKLGAGHAMAQALVLCERLYGSGPWSALAGRLAGRLRTRLLLDMAMAGLTAGGGAVHVDVAAFGEDRIKASHFLLADGAPTLFRELGQKLFSQADVDDMPLPRWLQFAYPLLRLPRLLWRRIAKQLRAARPAGPDQPRV